MNNNVFVVVKTAKKLKIYNIKDVPVNLIGKIVFKSNHIYVCKDYIKFLNSEVINN